MLTSGGERGLRPAPECVLQRELSALSALDRLRNDVLRLSLHRQDVYVLARAHRQGGHLVPASLCEELAQNESQLRVALDRYVEAAVDACPPH